MFSISKVNLFAALALACSVASAAPPGLHTGQAILFDPSGQSACGDRNIPPTEFVAGVSSEIFAQFANPGDNNPNNNPVCDRLIAVTGADGKSVRARIVEECAGGCGKDDVLLSRSAFSQLADPVKGRVPVTWVFFQL